MEEYKIGRKKTAGDKAIRIDIAQDADFIIATTLDTLIYDDITSVENWNVLAPLRQKDYTFIKEQMTMMYNNSGNTFSDEEMKIMCQYFVPTEEEMAIHFDEKERLRIWENSVARATKGRERRWAKAKAYISFYLSMENQYDLISSTAALKEQYTEYGLLTILDFLKGEGPYVGAGFPVKNYYTEAHLAGLLNILEEGIY